jgi:hypothetical protein
MNPYTHQTLARERQDMLLAEAEAIRQARQGRPRRRHRSTSATGQPAFSPDPASQP